MNRDKILLLSIIKNIGLINQFVGVKNKTDFISDECIKARTLA